MNPIRRVIKLEKRPIPKETEEFLEQLERMSGEDSFVVQTNSDRCSVLGIAARHGMRLITRKEGDHFRVWRIA
jgi:hypothetical protein